MEDKAGIRRIYRKSWPYDNLFGTLRHELDSAQRGVWNDLLDMAKIGRVRPGLVSPGVGKAYNHEWLAAFLNTPLELLEESLKLLKETKRITENGAGIEILNWRRYQTEYDRQKPYREAKGVGKEIHKICPSCDYKAVTSAKYCPKCEGVVLNKDWTGGKYGGSVRR